MLMHLLTLMFVYLLITVSYMPWTFLIIPKLSPIFQAICRVRLGVIYHHYQKQKYFLSFPNSTKKTSRLHQYLFSISFLSKIIWKIWLLWYLLVFSIDLEYRMSSHIFTSKLHKYKPIWVRFSRGRYLHL